MEVLIKLKKTNPFRVERYDAKSAMKRVDAGRLSILYRMLCALCGTFAFFAALRIAHGGSQQGRKGRKLTS